MSSSTRALVAAVAAAIAAPACVVPDPPPIEGEWTDDYGRGDIGKNYRPTSETYEIDDGVLRVQGAFNHPLWLRKKLPNDVQIDLDVWSSSADGDLKVELFGDGRSYARNKGAYTSTGYVFCMGGWNNTKSFIARGNEHGNDMTTRTTPKVVVDQKYRWRIVAKGGRLDWYVDDMSTPFLSFDDPNPLRGKGHGYFGFNNWQSDAHFDNLTITPL